MLEKELRTSASKERWPSAPGRRPPTGPRRLGRPDVGRLQLLGVEPVRAEPSGEDDGGVGASPAAVPEVR